MKTSYPYVLEKITLPYEGGKSDDPRDPGGRTNRGIIQREYNAYRIRKSLMVRSVYDMTEDELQEIYRKSYWDTIKGDELPVGVDGAVFDGGVMSGPAQSVKWLQRAIAKLGGNPGPVDGRPTMQTLLSARVPEQIKLVKGVCSQRQGMVQSLRTFATFGKGWTRRIAGVEAICVRMILSINPVATPNPAIVLSAESDQAKKDAAKSAGKAGGSAATGAISGGSTAPDVGVDPVAVKWVLIVVAVVATIAMAVYGWHWYVNRQRAVAYADEAAKPVGV